MADPPAKRRRRELVKIMDNLPPDVVVSHILPHFIIGVDIYASPDQIIGPNAVTFGCFGRFGRDRGRHAWAIFRSISVTSGFFAAAQTAGDAKFGQKCMIIPLRYVVYFTMPFRPDIHEDEEGAALFIQDLTRNQNRKWTPRLETVSNMLLTDPVDQRALYPNAETIILQRPMDQIPNWCEGIILREGDVGDTWISDVDPIFWVSKIGERPHPQLTRVVVELGTCLDSMEVVWDMKNVPALEKLVVGRGHWIPLKPRYRALAEGADYHGHDAPDYHDYDFLRPLRHLKVLSLRVFQPVTYNTHWFLPPVESRIDVIGFRVAAGFAIPPNARFVSCQWDPTCVYVLRPGKWNVLEIVQNVKHDAPNSVYQTSSRLPEAYASLPGRTTIRGTLRRLVYIADSFDLMPEPSTDPISELAKANQQAVIDRLGLPFEFRFIGNVHKALIISSPAISAGMPDNRIILDGQADKVELHNSESLELHVNPVKQFDVRDCRTCHVTTVGSICAVSLEWSSIQLTATYIDTLGIYASDGDIKVDSNINELTVNILKDNAEFVGKINKVHIDRCEKMVTIIGNVNELTSVRTRGTIVVTGSVGHASLTGPSIFNVYTRAEFDRVNTLEINGGFVDIVVKDMDNINSVIFGSDVRAEQIEFHRKRIDNRKLRFNGTNPAEVKDIKLKLSL